MFGELSLQFATHLAETNCSMLCFVFLTPKPSWSGCRSETAQEATAEKSRCLPAPAAGLQFTTPCFDLSNLSDCSWHQQQPITACYVSPYWLFCLLLLSDLTLNCTGNSCLVPCAPVSLPVCSSETSSANHSRFCHRVELHHP